MSGHPNTSTVGRLLRPADFERVLAVPPRSRSTHFAVHHLHGGPLPARVVRPKDSDEPLVPQLSPELSTGAAVDPTLLVDECQHWLGLVVPKRHARRSVTRNLLKRQLRVAMHHHAAGLPGGLWVVRLRAPFDRSRFVSPASELLREAVRAEVEQLFDQALHRPLVPGAARRPAGERRR